MANTSIYDQVFKQLKKEGRVRVLSNEENDQILEELNEGMEVFVYNQKVLELESEMELSGIILNA